MIKKINDLQIKVNDINKLKSIASKNAGIFEDNIKTFNILKKSIDARNKSDIKFIFSVELADELISKPKINFSIAHKKPKHRPLIIGSGPCGLFCALFLAKAGLNPIIFERGEKVDKRKTLVNIFFEKAQLNQNTNIQFGEGGAGTFSDGKLTTLIKSPYKNSVLQLFVEAGAPEEILYYYKPHIGTDKLINVIKNIRNQIINLGGQFHFNTLIEEIIIKNNKAVGIKTKEKEYYSDNIILAIGHSSRDTYKMLHNKGVDIQQKEFSCGFRIEHPQKDINLNQYGEKYYQNKNLGSADYKLVSHTPTGRSIYTFCMCPGGSVVAAASQKECLVTNGMSLYKRNNANANSALLCNVKKSDLASQHPLEGMLYQHNLEHKAFLWGGKNYYAPIQLVGDFLNKKSSIELASVIPSYKPGVTFSPLHNFFNKEITSSFIYAINDMSRYIKCFNMRHAVLTAVETRSSAPVRITRNKSYQSVNTESLYPAGEGSGYAGGIMSSAIDGIKVANAIIEKYL